LPKVAEREVGIEEGSEGPDEQLDESERDQHRRRRDQDRFGGTK
jgi:hypothetical protein